MIDISVQRVTSAPTYDDSVDAYVCRVTSDTFGFDQSSAQSAIIIPPAHGSVTLPPEGAHVLTVERDDGAFVVGAVNTETDGFTRPSVTAGERVIGTAGSDAHIRLTPSGDVIINGGDTRPITDVDFTNETVTRTDGVFVPP